MNLHNIFFPSIFRQLLGQSIYTPPPPRAIVQTMDLPLSVGFMKDWSKDLWTVVYICISSTVLFSCMQYPDICVNLAAGNVTRGNPLAVSGFFDGLQCLFWHHTPWRRWRFQIPLMANMLAFVCLIDNSKINGVTISSYDNVTWTKKEQTLSVRPGKLFAVIIQKKERNNTFLQIVNTKYCFCSKFYNHLLFLSIKKIPTLDKRC